MPTRQSRFPSKQQDAEYEGRVGLHEHWAEHGHEFPEHNNAREYLAGAIAFCSGETTRRFYYRRYGRPGIGYYDRETGTYAATSVDGQMIFTYFRPGPQRIDATLRAWRMPENEGNAREMPPNTTPRHATPLRRG